MAQAYKIITIMIFLAFFLVSSGQGEEKTRPYLVTGGWYPSSRTDLESMVDRYLARARSVKIDGKILGLIGPHAGLAYSGQCAANAYKQLENLTGIERVIMLGVSHRGGFYGACLSGFDDEATPLGKIPVDKAVIGSLSKEKYFRVDNTVMQHEHSLENHLPFLQRALQNRGFKIVPILFANLEEKDFPAVAGAIKKHVNDRTLVLASTDFTHYGDNFAYTPFKKDIKENLTKLDLGMIDRIVKLDLKGMAAYKEGTGITMCGFIPVRMMLTVLADKNPSGVLVDYCKSGDRENDYSLSVSYASILMVGTPRPDSPKEKKDNPRSTTMELTAQEKKTLLAIARETLEEYISKEATPGNLEKRYTLTDNLKIETGVFVTLKIGEHLRGCIGSLVGTSPLYLEVQDNAIKSAVQDPRFNPVQKGELKKIDIEISVMTPLQKIEDYKKIRLGIDGVIIKKGYYQAVFLPQVATETGWALDEFLGHLCEKAGLPTRAFQSPGMEFLIFQALIFGEKEAGN